MYIIPNIYFLLKKMSVLSLISCSLYICEPQIDERNPSINVIPALSLKNGDDFVLLVPIEAGIATVISLPPDEKVHQISIGSARNWFVTKLGDSGLSIVPFETAGEGEACSVTILSSKKNFYNFLFRKDRNARNKPTPYIKIRD